MKLKNTIIAAIAVATFVGSAEARGLLGQNYVEATAEYNYVSFDYGLDLDGWGSSVGGNFAVIKTTDTSKIGLDINAGLGYTKLSDSFVTEEIGGVALAAIGYYDLGMVKPMLGLGVSQAWGAMEVGSSLIRDNYCGASAMIGLEIEIVTDLTLSEHVSATVFEGATDDVNWSFGIDFAYWITEHFNLGLGGSYSPTEWADDVSVDFTVRYGF
ncbi:MAG: hypothetical protein SFY80_09850 [Verrucomicrobiota bacterium]|nr:hypothetical protein [Verrucomicrobiota bacterium]